MKIIQNLALRYLKIKFRIIAFFSKKLAAKKAFRLFCTPLIKQSKKTHTIFTKAEKLSFRLNGLTVNGYRWNHPKPYKLLILHGFSSISYKFSYYAEAFINKGYEVLAFDAPAHGESEGRSTNAVEYSDMIKKVIALFGPINAFMAHSFGGMALSLALEDVPHDEKTKVVFIAPATETTTALNTALTVLELNDPVIRKEIDNIIFSMSGKPTEWFSMKRAMHHIKAKILWIHDEEDDTTPVSDALKVKEENLSNIEFLISKGLGHRKIYHDAAIRKRIIDFL